MYYVARFAPFFIFRSACGHKKFAVRSERMPSRVPKFTKCWLHDSAKERIINTVPGIRGYGISVVGGLVSLIFAIRCCGRCHPSPFSTKHASESGLSTLPFSLDERTRSSPSSLAIYTFGAHDLLTIYTFGTHDLHLRRSRHNLHLSVFGISLLDNFWLL